MIARLRGTPVSRYGDRVVFDVHGVGYEVSMPSKALASLTGLGETVTVFTHMHVREDGMTLFGFLTEEDRDLFRIVLGASGVGPKIALAMFGTFSAESLRRAIAFEDVDALSQVPGVGKRTAQKIVLDLHPKLADIEAEVVGGDSNLGQVRAALEHLGYSAPEIREALSSVDPERPVPEQIREALRALGR